MARDGEGFWPHFNSSDITLASVLKDYFCGWGIGRPYEEQEIKSWVGHLQSSDLPTESRRIISHHGTQKIFLSTCHGRGVDMGEEKETE